MDKFIASRRLRIVRAFSPGENSTVEHEICKEFSTVNLCESKSLLRSDSTLLFLARTKITHSLTPTLATQSCFRVRSFRASEKYKMSAAPIFFSIDSLL